MFLPLKFDILFSFFQEFGTLFNIFNDYFKAFLKELFSIFSLILIKIGLENLITKKVAMYFVHNWYKNLS